ncbi:MAG: histidine phosphatase family protein [Spirochaetes bacterium]|nr:histidine phosphatase family protein [Spirochaetota bacterium]
MGTIYIARHALTDGHAKEIVLSWTPGIILNEKGRQQAKELAQALTPVNFTAVISSPIARAYETAGIVAESKGLPVIKDEAFCEWYMGNWSGRKISRIKDEFKEDFEIWRTAPENLKVQNAETLKSISERMIKGLQYWAEKYIGDTILIVSHKDPIRAMLTQVLGTPVGHIKRIDIEMASITRIKFNNSHFVLDMMNYIPWKPY